MTTTNRNKQSNTFKGTFYLYKNINGQVQRVEKQFDDPDQMNEFVKGYDEVSLTTLGWGNLDNRFDQMFDRRFALGNPSNTSEEEQQLNQLKQEKRRIEQEEQMKSQRQAKLQTLIEEATSLKEFFKQRNQKDKVQQAEETIASYKEQLKKLSS